MAKIKLGPFEIRRGEVETVAPPISTQARQSIYMSDIKARYEANGGTWSDEVHDRFLAELQADREAANAPIGRKVEEARGGPFAQLGRGLLTSVAGARGIDPAGFVSSTGAEQSQALKEAEAASGYKPEWMIKDDLRNPELAEERRKALAGELEDDPDRLRFYLNELLEGATAGHIGLSGARQPEAGLHQAIGTAARFAGMAGPLRFGTRAFGGARNFMAGPMAFGAYEAAQQRHGRDVGGIAKGGAEGVAIGVALPIGGQAYRAVRNKAAQTIGRAVPEKIKGVVKPLVEKAPAEKLEPLANLDVHAASGVGLNLSQQVRDITQGQRQEIDWDEAIIAGAGFALGGGALDLGKRAKIGAMDLRETADTKLERSAARFEESGGNIQRMFFDANYAKDAPALEPLNPYRPRMGRKSNVEPSAEFRAEAEAVPDIGTRGALEKAPVVGGARIPHWMPMRQVIERIGGGVANSRAVKELLRPIEAANLALGKMSDGLKANALEYLAEKAGATPETTVGGRMFKPRRGLVTRTGRKRLLGEVLFDVQLNKTEVREKPEKVLEQRQDIREALQEFTPEQQVKIVRAGQAVRAKLAELHDTWNQIRRLQGRDEIPFVERYLPFIRSLSVLEVEGRDKTAGDPYADFMKPGQAISPHARARSAQGLEYAKERNVFKLMDRYIDAMARDVWHTQVILHGRPYAEALRQAGKKNSAEALDTILDYSYANKRHPVRNFMGALMPANAAGNLIWKGGQAASRGVARAALGMNIAWNLFTQTSSAALVYVRTGFEPTKFALENHTNPELREQAKKTYAYRVKATTSGQVHRQDIPTQGTGGVSMAPASRTERAARAMLHGFTNAIEKELTIFSAIAGYRHGKQRGMTDAEAWKHGSDIAAKAQSMYNTKDLPLILAASDIGLLARFQTFAFEMFNMVREANVPVGRQLLGRGGQYRDAATQGKRGVRGELNRMAFLGRFVGMIMVQNMIHQETRGRDLWTIGSFVPFLNMLVGGSRWVDMYGGGKPLVTEFYSSFADAAMSVATSAGEDSEKFDIYPLVKWSTRWLVPGGGQARRTGESIQALLKGRAEIRGKEIYVDADDALEVMEALLFGKYAFSESQRRLEHLDRED